MKEIMNLKLHSELVVLSACETARGRISAGEGLIGFSWVFFIAGNLQEPQYRHPFYWAAFTLIGDPS